MSTWVGQYEPLSLCCLWTKVHQIFWPNVEGVVVDNGIFRFWTWWSVPKIFAIKVRSGRKSPEILHIFGPPIFFWGGGECPRIFGPTLSNPQVSDHVAKFHGDRSRDGGEKLAKEIKKKNITSKIEELPFYRTGGLNSVRCWDGEAPLHRAWKSFGGCELGSLDSSMDTRHSCSPHRQLPKNAA